MVSLVIKRPPHFTFKPGDYIFINIPAIATFEWHPFTISSAPEQSDEISLHIRVVGHWTNKLYEYFEAEQKRLQCTLEGGICPDPVESKYESFHKTMRAARERARKTSAMLTSGGAGSRSRRESTINNLRKESRLSHVNVNISGDNNNAGFVNLGADLTSDEISEVERNLRTRMKKKSALTR